MPDKIEKILKEIHVLLAGCPSANESGSEVIVNKKEVFLLLERLNYAILEVMDAWEVNERSKEMAIQRVQKDAQKIIDDASKSAEEIYAASIIYSDDALNELRDTVFKSRKNVMKEYEAMLKKIDTEARLEIEALMDARISLKLWVKVRKDWRNDMSQLRGFGYTVKK